MMSGVSIAVLACVLSICAAFAPFALKSGGRTGRAMNLEMAAEGGKIVVSGIGKVEQDEFMLNLLNEQVRSPCV